MKIRIPNRLTETGEASTRRKFSRILRRTVWNAYLNGVDSESQIYLTPALSLKRRGGSAGFTLVETLVALSIFIFSLIGLLSITANGLSDVSVAKNRATANYLAGEGIEFMRNMRDSAIAADPTGGWTTFLATITPCGAPGGGCGLDGHALSQTPASCTTSSTTCDIKQDSVTGYYGTSVSGLNTVPTIFHRVITTVPATGNGTDEMQVTSTVSWHQGVSDQSVSFTENLFNWQ